MPAQHYVPGFAHALHASSRAQANALRALAIAGGNTNEKEWKPEAAAALLLGAHWAGEKWTEADVAKAAGVPAQAVAKHYAVMAERLKGVAPR
jgi:transcription initiation factor TFIIIB Brf1 subunit/transcription initiation factor TFIIB